MTITVARKAWMAGILDYRGRIVYKENKTRNWSNQVTLYVESVQFPVIQRLAELTGGSPEVKKRSRDTSQGWFRRGCDEHCPAAHVHVLPGDFADAARWTISGSAMSVVLLAVQPFMVQDKGITEGIAYGLEHMKLMGQGAAATVTALRRLHGLGWPMPSIIEETRPGLFIKIRKGRGSVSANAEGWPATQGVPEVSGVPLVSNP
jgi:hypothetical protein